MADEKNEAVSVEFLEEQLARQKKHMAAVITIYAKHVSDIASSIADAIINAQADQLLTDDEISAKVGTTSWSERDYDAYRAISATVDLKLINDKMQHLLDGIIRLMAVIREEGGDKNG